MTQATLQKKQTKRETMKAALIREFGGPEVIRIEEIEKPQAKKDVQSFQDKFEFP